MFLYRLHSCWVLLLNDGLQITTVHVHIEELPDLIQRKHPWVAMVRALSVSLSILFVLGGFPLHLDLILQSQL